MAYEDRTYHGIQGAGADEDEWQPARLLIEKPEPGPTGRQDGKVLRELRAKDEWGYNGSGTSRAAAAILADALDLGTPEKAGLSMSEWPQDDTLVALHEDFCVDFLTQFSDEWRLSRAAVLRWARGWYIQRGVSEVPEALRDLPPLVDLRLTGTNNARAPAITAFARACRMTGNCSTGRCRRPGVVCTGSGPAARSRRWSMGRRPVVASGRM